VAVYFFDSSGLVKRYVAEVGSGWVISLTDPSAGHRIYVANIAAVEVPAAIRKRVRMGHVATGDAATAISDFENDYASQYNPIQVTDAIIASAATLTGRHPLRAYDAVQLASALEVNAQIQALGQPAAGLLSITFISADDDLNDAAKAEGLAGDNPNNHP
jgi:uncharacterized protein